MNQELQGMTAEALGALVVKLESAARDAQNECSDADRVAREMKSELERRADEQIRATVKAETGARVSAAYLAKYDAEDALAAARVALAETGAGALIPVGSIVTRTTVRGGSFSWQGTKTVQRGVVQVFRDGDAYQRGGEGSAERPRPGAFVVRLMLKDGKLGTSVFALQHTSYRYSEAGEREPFTALAYGWKLESASEVKP